MAEPIIDAIRGLLAQIEQKLAVSAAVAAVATTPASPDRPAAAGSLGVTPLSWTAPPSPWPIDARYLSKEQTASLDPDASFRANLWQQAMMSAAASGNGQNPVPQALGIYRAYFTTSADVNKPLTPIWQEIFRAYSVPVPA